MGLREGEPKWNLGKEKMLIAKWQGFHASRRKIRKKKRRRKQIFRDKRKMERGEIERDTKMQLRSYERACSIDQLQGKSQPVPRGRAANEFYFCYEEPGSLRRLTLSQG